MRRLFFVSVLSLTVLVIALTGGLMNRAGAVEGVQERPVNIRVTCDGGDVDEVNIRPWTAAVSRAGSGQVRWQLAGNGVSTATIRPKSTSTWPFATTPPLTVTQGQGTASGAITGGNGPYFYDIIVNCGNGDTVIDPRMDIRP